MSNEEETKSTENSHISRILVDDEFGKQFDVSPEGKNVRKTKAGYFNSFSAYEWRFIGWSSFIFIGCIFAFSSVGSLFTLFSSDDSADTVSTSTQSGAQSGTGQPNVVKNSYISPSNEAIELPTQIKIPKVGIDIQVRNPSSTDYKTLDAELTKGAVRYPGSGYPGKGNMLLFGHSTGFKVVRNQAYKAFNNIKTLVEGDSIYIYTATKTYEYRVTKVEKVNKYDTKISFDGVGDMITLSTCDSFGTKSDRYVVEATLVRN